MKSFRSLSMTCMARVDWAKYKVIGFTTTFAQTFSSLLLAKRLKERYPNIRIVFGGANVDAEMGFELVKAFDWVDYVVHGEGEEIFGRLLDNIYSEGTWNGYREFRFGTAKRRSPDLPTASCSAI